MADLDPRLAADTVAVCRLELCQVLLMNNDALPWLILVPDRPGLREIIDLPAAEQTLLMQEIARTSLVLRTLYAPDKINVGALGNVVSQLHVHVLARWATDPAWPGPVWGRSFGKPYDAAAAAALCDRLRTAFAAAAMDAA
ncbi:HIT domain-containing protein [Oleisolibacter albus]|uniref:HIT domain-containing protein n=1 Tax=Oleisolibacter albus TaxID=2171757 RepID=UPI000DF2A05B|nr:HIT family protein [Oleisolibacter albus]